MRDPRTWFVAILLGLCVVVSAAGATQAQLPFPSQPAPPGPPQRSGTPQPPAVDPRLAQIKAELEKQGMRVLEVTYLPLDKESPAHWFAYTPADYAQPDGRSVLNQGVKVWWVMVAVLAQEPPATILVSSQVWNKYILQLFLDIARYSTFLSNYRAAKNDSERNAAFNALSAKLRVWDSERQQWADIKDFMNKNFTR